MPIKKDRTKQHIINTFFEMMSEIGFEQIRVTSLTKFEFPQKLISESA